jgi:hypothetical protein
MEERCRPGLRQITSHRHRVVPMCHVDVKVPVAGDLEKHDATVVRQRSICRKSADCCLQRLNIRSPGSGEKFVI